MIDGDSGIVDVHKFDEAIADPVRYSAQFVDVWTQIAAAFSEAPLALYFELLNAAAICVQTSTNWAE